ncbi:high-affinity iron permease, partial [Modicella reniformis]
GVAAFESYAWNKATNARSDDSGTYDPRINVWALTCCNPKIIDSGFAQLMNALFGWSNVASVGSVVCYIGYWLVVIVALVYMKQKQRRAAIRAALDAPVETIHDDKNPGSAMEDAIQPVDLRNI